jgi:acetyltransferase-like isoleucine patch superfamily enzyme
VRSIDVMTQHNSDFQSQESTQATGSVFVFLWRNRKRHPFATRSWCLSWVKRMLALRPLISLCFRRNRLRRAGASIGEFAFVGEVTLVGPAHRLRIGSNSSIGDAFVMLHGEVEIGRSAVVNDFVTLLTASHDVADPGWPRVASKIKIGDFAWIAQGSMILPGVTVGRGAVVGAGAVVTRDVEDYAIVVGNPAVPIAKKRTSALNYRPVDSIAEIDAWLHWSPKPSLHSWSRANGNASDSQAKA